MPETTITTPVAADSIDRLALGACDARAVSATTMPSTLCMACGWACMAEE
jgi:hypothetical protein